MYGLAIKIWSSDFDKHSGNFNITDSVVYLCHDIVHKDIIYLSTVINHIVGDDSLENIFKKHIPIIKGEPSSGEESLDSLVKVEIEQQNESPDEDSIEGDDVDGIVPDDIDVYEAQKDFADDLKPKIIGLRTYNSEKKKKVFDTTISEKDDNEDNFVGKSEKLIYPRCGKCDKESSGNNGAFIKHLKSCNPEQVKSVMSNDKKYKKERDTRNSKRQIGGYCSYCPRFFTFKKSLENHEQMHLTDPDNPRIKYSRAIHDWHEKKRAEHGGLIKKGPSNPRGHYQCDKCVSVFSTKEWLLKHQKAHKLSEELSSKKDKTVFDERVYKEGSIMKCTTCDIVFTTHGNFQHHMKKYHHNAIVCDDCGKNFTMPSAFKTHILNYHTHFPKICDECGHVCETKKSYKSHQVSAHGIGAEEPRVPCEICGALLKNKYCLTAHVKLKHSGTASDFPCDTCGKRFKSKSNLENHQMIHTGEYRYRCDECGNGFMLYSRMMECKNTHNGIFKYQCPHCEYRTNRDKDYKRHLTIHSSAKDFICPLCDHRSSNIENLRSHVKKCHKITLLNAEIITKRNKFGHKMTEADIELAQRKMELSEKVEDIKSKMSDTCVANIPNKINRPKSKKPPAVKIKTQPGEAGL